MRQRLPRATTQRQNNRHPSNDPQAGSPGGHMNLDVHLHECLLHPQLNHDLCHRVVTQRRGKETSVGLSSRTTTCDVSTQWLTTRVSSDHGGTRGRKGARGSEGEPESRRAACSGVSASVRQCVARRQSAGHLVHKQTRRSASHPPGPRPRTS